MLLYCFQLTVRKVFSNDLKDYLVVSCDQFIVGTMLNLILQSLQSGGISKSNFEQQFNLKSIKSFSGIGACMDI